MTGRNVRTANYPEENRRRLGDAVATARRAAGFKWRTDFARAHADVSVSSLKLVEQAKPLVGITALQAIGRALGEHFNTWTQYTPVTILEGGPIPPATAENMPRSPTPDPKPRPQYDMAQIAVEALADMEVHGADATTYNRSLDAWELILKRHPAVEFDQVRREAHRLAANLLAERRDDNPTSATG